MLNAGAHGVEPVPSSGGRSSDGGHLIVCISMGSRWACRRSDLRSATDAAGEEHTGSAIEQSELSRVEGLGAIVSLKVSGSARGVAGPGDEGIDCRQIGGAANENDLRGRIRLDPGSRQAAFNRFGDGIGAMAAGHVLHLESQGSGIMLDGLAVLGLMGAASAHETNSDGCR